MRGRGKWLLGGGLGLVVVVVAAVAFWFQPQKLVIDKRVEDSAPTTVVAATADADAAAETTGPAPAAGAGGSFASIDHGTTGTVRIVDVGDGTRVVRLEGLATDNGPDLYLYLSANPSDGAEQAFDDVFVSLGRLKGNQGDQNYEVPADVDLTRYASVVIWCDRFNSAFGAAPLV